MNRREFIRAGVCGLVSTAVGTTASRPVRGGLASGPVAITCGRRVVNQSQYDDGSTPERPPEYEPVRTSVDSTTVQEITAGRRLAGELRSRLDDVAGLGGAIGADSGRLRVSRRSTDDGVRLVVDCPPRTDTGRIAAAVGTIAGRLTELTGDRLPKGWTVDVQDRPIERPEASCRGSVGRFSDARYREHGVAMGAAVRSETVGEIASTGFRGLRNGRAVIVTTAHTFARDDESAPADIRGAELYQSRQPHGVGRCHAAGEAVDAAAVAVDTDTYPSRYLADPGGDSYDDRPIVGTATWAALEAAQAEGDPIYKQGAVAGRCAGRITELSASADGPREFGVDVHSAGGDSGGPYFLETDDGLLVAGIHKGVRPETGQRRAIFVGSVLEALGVDIY